MPGSANDPQTKRTMPNVTAPAIHGAHLPASNAARPAGPLVHRRLIRPDDNQEREQRQTDQPADVGWLQRACHVRLRQSTMYCAPAGSRASLASSGLQRRQHPRKQEQEVGRRRRRIPRVQETPRPRRRQELRITIERNAAHDEPRARDSRGCSPRRRSIRRRRSESMHVAERIAGAARARCDGRRRCSTRDRTGRTARSALDRRRTAGAGSACVARATSRLSRDASTPTDRARRRAVRAAPGRCRRCRSRSRGRGRARRPRSDERAASPAHRSRAKYSFDSPESDSPRFSALS